MDCYKVKHGSKYVISAPVIVMNTDSNSDFIVSKDGNLPITTPNQGAIWISQSNFSGTGLPGSAMAYAKTGVTSDVCFFQCSEVLGTKAAFIGSVDSVNNKSNGIIVSDDVITIQTQNNADTSIVELNNLGIRLNPAVNTLKMENLNNISPVATTRLLVIDSGSKNVNEMDFSYIQDLRLFSFDNIFDIVVNLGSYSTIDNLTFNPAGNGTYNTPSTKITTNQITGEIIANQDVYVSVSGIVGLQATNPLSPIANYIFELYDQTNATVVLQVKNKIRLDVGDSQTLTMSGTTMLNNGRTYIFRVYNPNTGVGEECIIAGQSKISMSLIH